MLNITLEQYSELLIKLYDGAMEPSPWHNFLISLNELLNLRGCYLFLRFPSCEDDGLMFSNSNIFDNTPESSNIYNEQFYTTDPLIINTINEVITVDDLIKEKELLNSQFYKICMEPYQIRHAAGIDLALDNGQTFSLRLSRSAEQGEFTENEKQFIKLLSTHIQRAVNAGEKLVRFDTERLLWANTVSGKSIGVIMLDEKGLIIRSNFAADQYLREKDGIIQKYKNLHFGDKKTDKLFYQYLEEGLVLQRSGEKVPINAFSIRRPSGKENFQLVIKPILVDPMLETRGVPHFSVLIYSPVKKENVNNQVLMSLYDLTITETNVAIGLSQGYSLEELAEKQGMKTNTARSHIRSIYKKTGVTQQSQLVSLVLKSLANIS